MKNFWTRTASAVVYALLFISAILLPSLTDGCSHTWACLYRSLFLAFVCCVCTFEYYRIARLKGQQPIAWLGYIFSVGICLLLSASECMQQNHEMFFSLFFAALFPCVALVALVQLFKNTENPFADIAATVLPIGYVASPLGLMAVLPPYTMLAVVLILWANDCFAYMGGSMIGKHKLWPRHSPGKTWEGCACGLVFSVAVALILSLCWPDTFGCWGTLLAVAVIASVLGTLGDLAESMLKRSASLKDSGTIMPGHGGLLDRFDSLLFVVPAVFCLLTLINLF